MGGKTTQKRKHKSKYRKNKILYGTYGPTPLDLIKKSLNKEISLPYNEELPGNGQFYCRECDRYFIEEKVLDEHKKTKKHKKRVKDLKEEMHSKELAELAGGIYREKLNK